MEDIIVAIAKLTLAVALVATILLCTVVVVAVPFWIGKCLIMGAC